MRKNQQKTKLKKLCTKEKQYYQYSNLAGLINFICLNIDKYIVSRKMIKLLLCSAVISKYIKQHLNSILVH